MILRKSKLLSKKKTFTKTKPFQCFLHEIYGIGTDDSSYRSYLKKRILSTFSGHLYCLRIDNKTPEIIVSEKNIDNYTLFNDADTVITQAANLIRKEVLTYAQTIPLLSWPPNIEELRRNSENILKILTKFYQHILTPLVKQQTY